MSQLLAGKTALILGVANAIDIPTRQAFVVEMVGHEDLPNAIALNSSMVNLARLIGPSFAGVLIAAVGEGLAPGRRDIDATGRYVLPGGVDTHCHVEQLSGMGRARKIDTLLHAPFTLHERLVGGFGGQADHVACIGRNFRVDQNDAKHGRKGNPGLSLEVNRCVPRSRSRERPLPPGAAPELQHARWRRWSSHRPPGPAAGLLTPIAHPVQG